MKPYFLLIALILFSNYGIVFGQSENNFKIENGDLIWQKIYQCDTTINVIDKFVSSGVIANAIISNVKVVGDLKPFIADVKGAGYTNWNTPIYVTKNTIKGLITVDIKDNKYRVTIKDIRLTYIADDPVSDNNMFKTHQGEENELSLYAVKANTLTTAFLKAPSIIYNYTFEKRLNIKKEDNW